MGVKFTREQFEIIKAPMGDAAVVAAAGSGKSSVAAWRIAYLLKKHGFEPRNIAALTFGKQASASLLDRVVRTVEDKIDGHVHGMPDLFTGTIHSWAMHILKDHVPKYRKFEVLGEAERRLLVRRRFEHLGVGRIPRLAASTKSQDGPRFLTIAPEDVALFLTAIDRARDECLPYDTLPPELLSAFYKYQAALESAAAWDYASLIKTFLHTLSNTDDADFLAMQQDVSARLRVLVCDEGQDLDRAMWRLLLRLRELVVDVWCVGDHRQSVYRWRSADPETFLAFPERTRALKLMLSANFRSSSNIVHLANSFAKRFLGEKNDAMMQAASHHQHKNGDIAAVRFANQTEQYSWIARRVKQLLGVPWRDTPDGPVRGLAPSDMTVLVRTRRQMADVAAALRAEGINVIVNGAEALLVAPEAEALATAADYLGGGKASWDRKQGQIVTAPVSEDDVRATARHAFDLDDESLEHGVEWLRALPLSPDWERSLCLIEVLESWLQVMGVQFAGDGGAQEEVRWLAIRRVLDAAAAYQRWGFATPLRKKVVGFSKWLRIEASSVLKDERDDDNLRITPDAVTVQTCHNAKGLEYAVVAVPDLADSIFPARPRPSDLWHVLPRRSFTPAQARRLDGSVSDKMRDEANLFYVSLTRSAKYLFLTYSPPENVKRPLASPFFEFVENQSGVTRDANLLPSTAAPNADRLQPVPRKEAVTLQTTFSQFHIYTTCPRAFYLRHVLNIPPSLNESIGFGVSVHSACWETHKRVMNGEKLNDTDIEAVASRHLSLPFASAGTREGLGNAAVQALRSYVADYLHSEQTVESAEQEVRLDLGSITLIGRIDLAYHDSEKRLVLDEVKTERGLGRDENLLIPQAYAIAYEQTRGSLPDCVGVRSLANKGNDAYRSIAVTEKVIGDIKTKVAEAGEGIARRRFSPLPIAGAATCSGCDAQRVCRHCQHT